MRSGAFLTRVLIAGYSLVASAGGSLALPVSALSVETPHGIAHFRVEIAADAASRDKGLMFRKHLAKNAGMLFDFHQDLFVAFWMKNTPLPLDMIFIRRDGTISSVEPNAVPYSTNEIKSTEPIRAVLEINGGRAGVLGVVPGEKVHNPMFNTAASRP